MTKKPTVNVSTRENRYVVLSVAPDNDITARLKAAWDTLHVVRLDATLPRAEIYTRVTAAMNAITDALNATELILTRAEALALAQTIENWAEDLPSATCPAPEARFRNGSHARLLRPARAGASGPAGRGARLLQE